MTSGLTAPDVVSQIIPYRPDAEVAILHSRAPAREIDTQFNALFSTVATLIVFSLYSSSASCVVTATACSDNVVFFEILLRTCCSVVLDCSSLTSRGSLFVVILLLLCDPDGCGRAALFSSALSPPHRDIATSVILAACSRHVLAVLSSPATLPLPVFGSLLAVLLGRVPEPDDPPWETGVCGGKSCSVSSAIFFRGSGTGWQTTPALFSMPLVPGSLVASRSTAPASARFICSSAAASRVDPDELPPNRASILLRHASL